MRWSLFLTAASAAAVSASVLQPRATFATNLPAAAFPTFTPISLEDMKNELDLVNITREDDGPDFHPNRLAKVGEFDLKVATTASCNANPQVRMEWSVYPTADRIAFVNSIKCLMGKAPSGKFSPSKSRYEDFVRLHQWYMPNVHGNANFLIWHRYYLWVFEQTLMRECGLKKPMPWWDETLWAGKFSQSDMFTDTRYFGHMIANPDGSPHCISSGAFADLVCNIGPGSSSTPHCLSRAVNGQLTAQVTQSFVDTCNARTSYVDMASCSEKGPHAYGHNGIGGVMSDVSASPSDPVFWMHHSFVDHSFRIWQNQGGATRVQSVNGNDAAGKALSMSYVIAVSGISGFPNIPISSVMNTMSGVVINGATFCYRYNR